MASKLTVAALKAALEERGVKVPAKATKPDLVKLYEAKGNSSNTKKNAATPKAATNSNAAIDVSTLKVAELRELLKKRGVDAPASAKKADLVALASTKKNSNANTKKNSNSNTKSKTAKPNSNSSASEASAGRSERSSRTDSQASPTRTERSEETSGFLSTRKWTNANVRAQLSNSTFKAMTKGFQYLHLSKVQAATLEPMLAGDDFFAKSKTGSGKTLSFLIPILEGALKSDAKTGVHAVVVSPTKELAAQTHAEAGKLLQFSKTPHKSVLIIGGAGRGEDMRVARGTEPIAVVVATPGRLNDDIKSLPGFKEKLAGVKVIVLDEADRMLDQGFRPAVEAILGALPKERQTVLISATMPPSLLAIANKYMRPGWKQIDVTDPGAPGDDDEPKVNPMVEHRAVVAPAKFYARALAQAIEDHTRGKAEYKVIVFLPGVKMVALATALFKALGYDADEIHSDMSTGQRAKAAQNFATAKKAILFGTDAIARGVDFPNVSFVVQAGVTQKETYTHRVGRTGRGGRSGEALLIASDFEDKGLKDALKVHLPESSWSRWDDSKALTARSDADVAAAAKKVSPALYNRAYKGWVGAYASVARDLKIAKGDVPALGAELFTQGMGMPSVPEISPELRKKMGLPPA